MIVTSVMKEFIENFIDTYIKPIGRWYLDLVVKRLYYNEWMAVGIGWSWLCYCSVQGGVWGMRWCSINWKYFTPSSSVSIIDFEQVNISCDRDHEVLRSIIHYLRLILSMHISSLWRMGANVDFIWRDCFDLYAQWFDFL